ncbi:PREDICTED: uncharacterized protein LOC108620553 [Drosophila arizonae]|uniref:Uncharacterized protein LOC108620553 n=1 Tax=Drosophila arizonae TaxID=7263 RepID=A0ABM1Q0G2_DROAR|nr:PREDICTED: uncharacterized protein LOC108620553 [Drosophila arizonae]
MLAELNKIQQKLQRNQLRLSENSPKRLQLVYKLMKAQAIFKDNMLVIDARLPIYINQHATLLEPVPIPLVIKGRKVIPRTKTKFPIFNTEINAYHSVTEMEVGNCRHEGETTYLCEGSWAWEIKPNNKQPCKMMEYEEDTFVKKRNGKNRWLFKVFEKKSAHITCGNYEDMVL